MTFIAQVIYNYDSFTLHLEVNSKSRGIINKLKIYSERESMKNILIHGLGQNHHSWDSINQCLKANQMDTVCPDLFDITKNAAKAYPVMYAAFSAFCQQQKDKLNLCGLSLGGILALDYIKEHPEKVNSLILIGTPYTIPKVAFKLQNLVFHMMPSSVFEKMGCPKKDLMALVNSMAKLDIAKGLEALRCKSLIICGEKDKANRKSAQLLQQHIQQSELKIIRSCSHEVNREQPKELAHVIYTFWQDKQ